MNDMAERIYDILARQKAAAVEAGNPRAAKALRDLQRRVAGLDARGFFVPDAASEVTTSIPRVRVFTRETFRDYLNEGLKTRKPEIALPEPSQAIVKVHNILAGNGFDVVPVVYIDREKREVAYGVLETVVRPDCTSGIQMYYSNPDEDPLARILEQGRTGRQRRIAVPNWASGVSTKSRFAVSWDEIHGFVAPEVIETILHLKEQVSRGGVVFRVPTKAEFQVAGERYPHFGGANTWEWLYDVARFGRRLVGGSRDDGGLRAVVVWRPDDRSDNIGFRLQAISPPQKPPQ